VVREEKGGLMEFSSSNFGNNHSGMIATKDFFRIQPDFCHNS
jgi:hypothetical protein